MIHTVSTAMATALDASRLGRRASPVLAAQPPSGYQRGMHRRTALLSLLALVATTASSVYARPPEARLPVHQVQRDVEAILRALYAQDVATVMRFTHPAIVQMLGGPEAAKRAVTAAAAQIGKVGMKIEAFSFPSPPQFFEAGGRRFVFVPTLTILAAKAGRVESLNFQFGVLEPAASDWKYIEGSRVTHAMAESLFPGFPKERPFPPFYRKKL